MAAPLTRCGRRPVAAGADPSLADTLRAALVANLAAASVGQGGSFDVFSAELDRELAQDAAETGGQG
jgi:glutathione S-transferase